MVLELRTGRTRPMRLTTPLFSSAAGEWDGVLVEEHPPSASESTEVALFNTAIFLILDQSATLEWQGDGRLVTKRIQSGQISILPANHPYSVKLRAAGGSVVVSLDQKWLTCAAAEQGQMGEITPIWVHGVHDALARELVLALRLEMRRGADSNRSYTQSLVSALAAHVVRQYSTDSLRISEQRGGLSAPVLRRTIGYVQEHLGEDLSIDLLAAVADLSPCHFARMFKRSIGMTPRAYLLHCRIALAKRLLLRKAGSLADVALQAGFCDQGHMTRAFRDVLGITPAAFVRSLAELRRNTT